MLTLYHSPYSRSTRVIRLLHEMDILDQVEIKVVEIARQDGTGGHDPDNPHPEGKVPLLVHDGVEIRETGAIMLYLTDMFPESGLGVPAGHPMRGAYLSWLFWYGGVLEPVLIHGYAELDHPALISTFRTEKEATEVLKNALTERPYLLGDRLTAADIICFSPYSWFPGFTPDVQEIKDWIERCKDTPAKREADEYDVALMAARAGKASA